MRNGVKRRQNRLKILSRDVPRGPVADRERPEDCVWQKIGRETYVTCPCCRSINRITDHLKVGDKACIRVDGRINTCVTCVYCEGHFYACLSGWKGTSFICCSRCGRNAQGLVRKFKDWDIDYMFCPECRKSMG